jgi:AraC family cel operon transcriptional repressor
MAVLNLDRYLSERASFYIHRDDYGPGSGMKVHSHDFAEIFLVEKGRGHHRINGLSFRLEEGMLCIVRDRDEHSLVSRGRMRILNIAFPSRLLGVLEREESSLFPLPESRTGARLEDEHRDRFISLCYDLSMGSRELLDMEIFLLELLRLLRDRRRTERESGNANGRSSLSWLKRFDGMLKEPEELGLNVEEMAERLEISREHLSREVRRVYGKGPSALMTEARIRYACHLLRMSSLSIAEVSVRCGYSSSGRFYTRFRELMGETPGQFRNYRP